MESRANTLLVVLLLLGAACTMVLLEQAQPRPAQEAHERAFQSLVGGLGFGPAVDLSGCAFGFDPRLDGSCAVDRGPIPGGGYLCPRHAGSVFCYPPVGRGTPPPTEAADATPP
jgi:hypothetical protein